MKMTPQRYESISSVTEATEKGCDIVQHKYAGLWVRVSVTGGTASVLNAHNDVVTHFPVPDPEITCTLVGDLFGPPRHEISKVIVWDCWETRGEDISLFRYRDRFAIARANVQQIGLPLILIQNFPIAAAQPMWADQSRDYCGLVFRGVNDPATAPVYVIRKYREVPAELAT